MSCCKQALEKINSISQQLLLCLQSSYDNILVESFTVDKETDIDERKKKHIKDTELAELIAIRERLISELFTQYTPKLLSKESALINEMVSLDKQLTAISNNCKQSLSEQVIKLKNSKKITKTYQKY